MNISFDIVEILLANGANINATNRDDETLLINAAEKGRFDEVKFLLEKGEEILLWAKKKLS